LIKSLVQWGSRLSLMGTLLLSPVVGLSLMPSAAIAIPEAQIERKLQGIPVYAISDEEGVLLTVSVPRDREKPDEGRISLTRVFISQTDAQSFLAQVRESNPDIPQGMSARAIPLSEVYKLHQEYKDAEEPLVFQFQPKDEQVNQARTVLQQQGDPELANAFQGVPLFMAKAGEDRGYLTIQNGDRQAVLAFFDHGDLEQALEEYKKQNSDANSQIVVQVTTLERLMDLLITEDDPFLQKVELIPTPESRSFLQQEIERRQSGN